MSMPFNLQYKNLVLLREFQKNNSPKTGFAKATYRNQILILWNSLSFSILVCQYFGLIGHLANKPWENLKIGKA
jgi:hypothetical protein